MAVRLSRAEQSGRNRTLVLRAARRVFLARGYHAATLDQIAEAAGFSKGVVYSQFRSKADLFLALLDARIAERAQENARLVEGLAGDEGISALLRHVWSVARAEPQWGLLVIEFRVHVARDPELNRRYAAAHERTIAGLARLLATLYERAGEPPPLPARELAELVLAIGAGTELELAANPAALGGDLGPELLTRLLGHDTGSVR